MPLQPSQPIGIFDSGVGGLTVAAAVKQLLPSESMIYFGDIAHLPYGDKSGEAIRFYTRKIADFLLEMDAKLLLIACNTASAAAYDDLLAHVGDKALVVNVIDPVVSHIASTAGAGRVGVIGTKGTINSGSYEKKIRMLAPGIRICSLATPLLVPMIEEGFVYDDISNAIIRKYLSHEKLRDIDSLILGCTHYPIIKNQIRKFYDFRVEIVDSAQVVAAFLKNLLLEKNLMSDKGRPEHRFFVSDHTDYFSRIARFFFEENIELELRDIWR